MRKVYYDIKGKSVISNAGSMGRASSKEMLLFVSALNLISENNAIKV